MVQDTTSNETTTTPAADKRRGVAWFVPLLAGIALAFAVQIGWAADTDFDGVEDELDNCLDYPNPDQRDPDAGGFGTICDPDFNNDCFVNPHDLQILVHTFFTDDENTDLNGDGVVNSSDLRHLKQW